MSAAAPLTILNGRLVLPTGEPQLGGIRCADGWIAALGDVTAQPGDTVIDAKGALIAPGLVDLGSSRSTNRRFILAELPGRR